MREAPVVSVILPGRNRAHVVADAIESVLHQSFRCFELILIDDASTDGTVEVMRRYERVDPRVRVIRNEMPSRGGPIEWEARNDGLKLSRGRYVAYLDSDNTWRPAFLDRLSEVLDQHENVQLAHCDSCNHYAVADVDRIVARDPRTLVDRGPDWTVFSYDRLDPALLGQAIYIDTNEIMHRAAVFERLGYLWRTVHPRRAQINTGQWPRRRPRRHNDLDLVERVIRSFGTSGVFHVPEVHVDYYYASAERRGMVRIVPEASTSRAG